MGAAEALGGAVQHKLGGANWIGYDIRVPEAQNPPADAFKIFGAGTVIALLIEVLAAVEFDSEFGFAAGDVDNIMANNKLPREGRPITRQ